MTGQGWGKFVPAEEIFFCNNAPDLPIALVATLLHSNKINANLLKEILHFSFVLANTNAKNQSCGIWMPCTACLLFSSFICFWLVA